MVDVLIYQKIDVLDPFEGLFDGVLNDILRMGFYDLIIGLEVLNLHGFEGLFFLQNLLFFFFLPDFPLFLGFLVDGFQYIGFS